MKIMLLCRKLSVSSLALMILFACSNEPKKIVDRAPTQYSQESIILPKQSFKDTQNHVGDYALYQESLRALKSKNTTLALMYLSQQSHHNGLNEYIQIQTAKNLAYANQWSEFLNILNTLPKDVWDQEIRCYHDQYQLQFQGKTSHLLPVVLKSNERLSTACNRLILSAAKMSLVSKDDVWRRVMILLSHNQVTLARQLAASIDEPLPNALGVRSQWNTTAGQIGLLYAVITPKNRNKPGAEQTLNAASDVLTQKQIAFAQGILGLSAARDLKMSMALRRFQAAEPHYLNHEQWAWYARSALRQHDWRSLKKITSHMPDEVKNDTTWQYWRARALRALGHNKDAEILFETVSKSGRNFYALMATEALGEKITVKNNVGPASKDAQMAILNHPQIAHALTLFTAYESNQDMAMRQAAQRQWRYAIRHFSEDQLLAASEVALNYGFLEMAIYSADKTHDKLNYSLRYLSPYKDLTEYYASVEGVDSAWVYGLIRQESRFMIAARSHVGASGLMQIMPATARFIAKKMGLDGYQINNIENNIKMGTWYLADIEKNLGHPVLATAGYNAGPGRARAWRAAMPLEGAIYAETIPFNETRDYVKKVMANTVYYSHLFGRPNISLTATMGTIPAKP